MPKITEVSTGVHVVEFPLPTMWVGQPIQQFRASDIDLIKRVADIIDSCKVRLGGRSYDPAPTARMPFGKDVCGLAAEVAVCRFFAMPWRVVVGSYDGGVDIRVVKRTAQVKFTGRMKNDFYFTSAEEVRQKFVADIGISVALDDADPGEGFVLRLNVRGWISRDRFLALARERMYGLSTPAYGIRPFELWPMCDLLQGDCLRK